MPGILLHYAPHDVAKEMLSLPEFDSIVPFKCLNSQHKQFHLCIVWCCLTYHVSLKNLRVLHGLTLMSKYSFVVVNTNSSGLFLWTFVVVDLIKSSKGPVGFKSPELLAKVSVTTEKTDALK